MLTFYWYDLETFGIDSRRDRIAQFAGIRTDQNLEPIGSALSVFCRSTADVLPSPDACLISGITPQFVNRFGIPEFDFIQAINREFSVPNTCVIGYNNLRFDDEFIRSTLFRNLFDPYAREWQDGCTRWDLIDVVRMCRALRPEGIQWPIKDDGTPSYRLEDICKENYLEHVQAHDASSDVVATIELAKLIRKHQPRLFEYLFQLRRKDAVRAILEDLEPLIHVSEKFPARDYCLALVLPIAPHPRDANGVIAVSLMDNPDELIHATPEAIRSNIFSRSDLLPKNTKRFGIKTIHLNRCPALAPLSVLGVNAAKRLNIDLSVCRSNAETLRAAPNLRNSLLEVFAEVNQPNEDDPELTLYSGRFFSPKDRAKLSECGGQGDKFARLRTQTYLDERIPELLFRAQARSFPETLSSEDAVRWRELRERRFSQASAENKYLSFDRYFARIEELKRVRAGMERDLRILSELEQYGRSVLN